jgi:hypothetical protein
MTTLVREAFSDAMADFFKIEAGNRCSLSVLDPTPNNASSIGENRAKNITLIGLLIAIIRFLSVMSIFI